MFYVYVIYTNIMNVLRTGMNMSISHIRIWLWYIIRHIVQTSDEKALSSFHSLLSSEFYSQCKWAEQKELI